MDDKVKQEIIDFLKAEQPDVKEAVRLLTDHGTNQTEVRVFCASPERYIMQMRWALAKLIPISLTDFQKGYFTDIRYKEEKDYPAIILRLKEVLPQMMKEREQLQKDLVALGDANDEETKAKAAELGQHIDVLATRYQLLYEAKEAFFNSEGELIPDEAELFPEEDGKASDVIPPVVKYEVLEKGDPVEIMKRKKNLESSLTKDRNLLQYQSKSKPNDGKDNPMPQGPERDKVEARIKDKVAELEAINTYLASKENADKGE